MSILSCPWTQLNSTRVCVCLCVCVCVCVCVCARACVLHTWVVEEVRTPTLTPTPTPTLYNLLGECEERDPAEYASNSQHWSCKKKKVKKLLLQN